MKQVIFFGAGQIGKYMLEQWREYGIEPDYFADNSEDRWGTFFYGIKVLSIEELKAMGQVYVLITCKQIDSISAQLQTYGIRQENIFPGNTIKDMVIFLSMYMKEKMPWENKKWNKNVLEGDSRFCVMFDVQHSFVLGGVEEWTLQMDKLLSAQKIKVKFITTDLSVHAVHFGTDKEIQLQYWNDPSIISRMVKCLSEIRNNTPCNIVCNFAGDTFQSACVAKILWPQEVNLIAVVHNEEEVYYEQYGKMSSIIDYCLVTCDMMERQLIERGMAKEKLLRLAWQIPCEKTLNRIYSKEGQPIRIGYAGRLVKNPKRLDLLIDIVKRLKSANVDFWLEIAGTGDYEADLKMSLEEFGEQVCFKGYVNREHIADFWMNQDIGVNCSDLEGRCISKAESMAAGAVPVITDTSSARDDVQDGYNGYVVPVGDADGIADRIRYLYHHRELLKVMGERSHQIILKQNEENDLVGMWKKILKR